MRDTDFKFTPSVVLWPLYLVIILWAVYTIEILYPGDFTHLGILPRTLSGLKGIFFSPFLHGDTSHLANNSIPLFLLVAALLYFYKKEAPRVLFLGVLFTGIGTWLIGRDSYHIGASGLIYVLVSFMFFKGIQSKYFRLVALSLTIVSFYGSMVWYIFPTVESNISWEAHLSGFVTGFLLARFTKTNNYQRPIKYDWEHPDFDPSQDEFMKHFDENGNFAPIKEVVHEEEVNILSFFNSTTTVVYEYKKEAAENKN